MFPEPVLLISALQHFAYCPRQFALIHLEQAWADNYFTAEGNILHERVDSYEAESRRLKRSERSVEVSSNTLGLHGKLDLLEIYSMSDGAVRYLPVEYKRGSSKPYDWDRIQLCAQALCLEEMRGVGIPEGALWYWQDRRRELVEFNEILRESTLNCIKSARDILQNQITPPPTVDKKRCKACSLSDVCMPHITRTDRSALYVESLFMQTSCNNAEESDE